jgi:hypothetical protein
MDQKNVLPSKTNERTSEFPSLYCERRTHVETACAAYYLNLKPQTLRSWASLENGPIRPKRISRRLNWPVEEIKILLSIEKSAE